VRHITIDRNFCRLFQFTGNDPDRAYLMPIYVDDDQTAWASNGHMMRRVPLPFQGPVAPTALIFDTRIKLLNEGETRVLTIDDDSGTFEVPDEPSICGKLGDISKRPDPSYAIPNVAESFAFRGRYFTEVVRSLADHLAIRVGLQTGWSDRHHRTMVDPFGGILFSTTNPKDYALVMPARLDDMPRRGDRRLRVVVETPYAGGTADEVEDNKAFARACMLDSMGRGEDPFASHLLYTQFLDDKDHDERKLGMRAGFNWRATADMTVVYTDRGVTPGMERGIEHSEAIGVPVVRRTLEET